MDSKNAWQKIVNGDQEAFNALFRKIYPELKVYGMALSNNEPLVQDALQNLFVKLWGRRTQLGHIESIKHYLYRSFRNTLLDLIKEEQKYLGLDQAQLETKESFISLASEDEQSILEAKNISYLLEQLPIKQKEIIYLRFYNHLSFKEIAEIMDLRYQTVRNYSVKAIQFLVHNSEK